MMFHNKRWIKLKYKHFKNLTKLGKYLKKLSNIKKLEIVIFQEKLINWLNIVFKKYIIK
jgi:hypothetical protein